MTAAAFSVGPAVATMRTGANWAAELTNTVRAAEEWAGRSTTIVVTLENCANEALPPAGWFAIAIVAEIGALVPFRTVNGNERCGTAASTGLAFTGSSRLSPGVIRAV